MTLTNISKKRSAQGMETCVKLLKMLLKKHKRGFGRQFLPSLLMVFSPYSSKNLTKTKERQFSFAQHVKTDDPDWVTLNRSM